LIEFLDVEQIRPVAQLLYPNAPELLDQQDPDTGVAEWLLVLV
jgi:hypothetical protein